MEARLDEMVSPEKHFAEDCTLNPVKTRDNMLRVFCRDDAVACYSYRNIRSPGSREKPCRARSSQQTYSIAASILCPRLVPIKNHELSLGGHKVSDKTFSKPATECRQLRGE